MPQKVKKKGRERKEPFCDRLETLLQNYPAVFIVLCNNIGSAHMQKIKKSLRDKAIIVKRKKYFNPKSYQKKSRISSSMGCSSPLHPR